jgi:hypothetical protein
MQQQDGIEQTRSKIGIGIRESICGEKGIGTELIKQF